MKYFIKTLILALLITSFKSAERSNDLAIQWERKLEGDFSFYPKNSLNCEAWCYEFAGVTEIFAKKDKDGIINCYTIADVGTHSTLRFLIDGDSVKNVRIELVSITAYVSMYPLEDGFIKIDKELFQKGILKADFNFTFVHNEETEKFMYWKGKIYTKISNK